MTSRVYLDQSNGYKAYVISTIVDIKSLVCLYLSGYKAYVISTIVDNLDRRIFAHGGL